MKTINVTVRDKIASAVGDIVYICGNSDYIINFDFDAEWDDYDVKTARFMHDGSYIDIVFTGNQCAMPVIYKAYGIYVGVYAGDLRTTTPAHIPSAASILSADGTPAEPPDDVYAQITALCNEAVAEANRVRDDADAGKFDGAPGKTPVAGVDYFTTEDKQAIAAEAAKEVGFPPPKVSDNGKYLGCENGAATWMPVEAPGGGAAQEKIIDVTFDEEFNAAEISVDINGNPFLLSEFTLWFKVALVATGSYNYCRLSVNEGNNGSVLQNLPGMNFGTGTVFSVYGCFAKVRGDGSVYAIYGGQSNSDNSDARFAPIVGLSSVKKDTDALNYGNGVYKINISGIYSTLAKGTRLIVYGVRK